jgi:hypothetical protein
LLICSSPWPFWPSLVLSNFWLLLSTSYNFGSSPKYD